VTNFGGMYSYHVLLRPLAVVVLVVAHVLLVRRHGVVPPLDLASRPGMTAAGPSDADDVGGPSSTGARP